jgi:hypothetical protein
MLGIKPSRLQLVAIPTFRKAESRLMEKLIGRHVKGGAVGRDQ